jgi:nitronate monooxygenase
MGTRFIATREANASVAYKEGIVASRAADVVYTPYFTGVAGNYLKSSIVTAGLDPDNLPAVDKSTMNFGGGAAKAWRDIWGVGLGVGGIDDIPATAELIGRLKNEYAAALAELCARQPHPEATA